jgi:hypothetical protein
MNECFLHCPTALFMIMKQILALRYDMSALAAQLGFKSFCDSCVVLPVLLIVVLWHDSPLGSSLCQWHMGKKLWLERQRCG